MSAVEQAVKTLDAMHASTMRTARTIGARESLVAEAEAEYRTVRDALIATVRAERDAAWREGVEKGTVAEGGHLPECAKETQCARYCDCGAWGARHAHNAALAALAARMEAK